MSATKVEAKLSTSDRVFSTDYDFGDNLDEAVAKFGAETVYTKFKQSSIIDLQSVIRRHLAGTENKDGTVTEKTDDEIRAAIADWEPGSKTVVRKSPLEKAREQLGKLSDEEKAALLAQLQAG